MEMQTKIGVTQMTTVKRIKGKVTGIHPTRKDDNDNPTGGYIWIKGEDEVAYFGHVTQIAPGVDLLDLRQNQECTFTPSVGGRGPAAMEINF
jgi:hypothetical protein